MTHYFVFNGDADGICAAQQLLLAAPEEDPIFVTGVKRDISLLGQLDISGADVTVLDVAVEKNLEALTRLLETGCRIRYFDHHVSPVIPEHQNLDCHIDTDSSVNTSLLVYNQLGAADPSWAVAGLFGDNMKSAAEKLAQESGLDQSQTDRLAELGELLNYNAYGDSTADLHYHPADVLASMILFADTFQFMQESSIVDKLRTGQAEDLRLADGTEELSPGIRLFPDAQWARRVIGIYANRWAQAEPDRAHAVLVTKPGGGEFVVSVRSPLESSKSAADLCSRFPTGGGRVKAAGINRLPEKNLSGFVEKFRDFYN